MVSLASDSLSREVKDVSKSIKEMLAVLKSKGRETKEKEALDKHILKGEITKLQQVGETLSSLSDPDTTSAIFKQKQELLALEKDTEEKANQVSQLRKDIKEAEAQLATVREQQQGLQNSHRPRARYAVNLYRQVSNIRWQIEHSSPELKGFIQGRSTVKPFCFDEQKQSKHFITSSLWEMGEEEVW